MPLMETVSRPELASPAEATAYLKAFRAVLLYLGVCDGNMEEGSLRCDANISLRPAGNRELGTKVEIKNLNSFRNVQRALEFEIGRQAEELEAGRRIVQETRLFDADRGVTRSMRSKEYAHDYRYFPEPDLVPVVVEEAWLAELRASLPELPDVRKVRFVSQYGLPAYDAGVLTASRAVADFYEEVVRLHPDPKAASNWVMVELLGLLNRDGLDITKSPVKEKVVADLLGAVKAGKISGSAAKMVFERAYEANRITPGTGALALTGEAPEVSVTDIIKREGLEQVSDAQELARIVDEVLAANASVVAEFRAGKERSFTFLVGQAMRATRGKGNPKVLNELLRARLARDPGN
jgi:aspartyl-tRNA(Asn)/glutamyl-tRNA(Gln) amidotransferase subunit B